MKVTPSEQKTRHISRRDFLKLAAVGSAGGWLALRQWANENGPASLLSDFLLGEVKSEVPPEFLNEKEDPNPSFENPDRLLEESFKIYNRLSAGNPSQYPALILHRRGNYISMEDVIRRYKGSKPEEIIEDITSRQFTLASKALDPEEGNMPRVSQLTGGDILYFSRKTVNNVSTLIRIDPGSGFISRAISRSFNINRESFYSSHPLEKGFSENETKKIQESIVKDLTDAVNYFKSLRGESKCTA